MTGALPRPAMTTVITANLIGYLRDLTDIWRVNRHTFLAMAAKDKDSDTKAVKGLYWDTDDDDRWGPRISLDSTRAKFDDCQDIHILCLYSPRYFSRLLYTVSIVVATLYLQRQNKVVALLERKQYLDFLATLRLETTCIAQVHAAFNWSEDVALYDSVLPRSRVLEQGLVNTMK